MATKKIETTAVIGAEDRAGPTISQIGAKLERLERQGEGAARGIARGFDNVATAMSKAGREADRLQEIQRLRKLQAEEISRRMSQIAPVAAMIRLQGWRETVAHLQRYAAAIEMIEEAKLAEMH